MRAPVRLQRDLRRDSERAPDAVTTHIRMVAAGPGGTDRPHATRSTGRGTQTGAAYLCFTTDVHLPREAESMSASLLPSF